MAAMNWLQKLWTKLGNPAGASISADIAAVKVDTAANAKTTELISGAAVDFGAVAKASINTEVDSALNTAIPGTNVSDSVNDVLLDQVKPRLPGSGTIATTADLISGAAVDFGAAAKTSIQTAADAALTADALDHLAKTADGAGEYPASVVNGSILSKLMSKTSGGVTSSYDEQTDSLEAISDKVTAIGTGTITQVYREQIPDTDFSLAAIDTTVTTPPPSADAANSVVDIDVNSGDTFVLRELIVNVTSFGTGAKLTFDLWSMCNTAVTKIDSVDVADLGFYSLMDIFGRSEVHGDGIWITVKTDVGSTGACSGTYRFAKAST
jgi:hypothetical protein